MVFLLGKTLPAQQHVLYALAGQFEGVGRATAGKICAQASVHKFCRVRDLNERHISRLRDALDPHLDEQKRMKIERARLARLEPVPVDMR